MNINSDTVIGAALRTAVTKPGDATWLELSDAERAAYIAAASHLRAYTGPGPIKRFGPAQLGKALSAHNAALFPAKAPEAVASLAEAAGAAFINVAVTVCDDIY